MENSITKRIEDYLDEIDLFCHGFDSKLIFLDPQGVGLSSSTQYKVNHNLKRGLEKFFESTRSLAKNDELFYMYNSVRNFLKEVEEKTLIDFDSMVPGSLEDKHEDYINDPYSYHASLFDGVKQIFKLLEGEIDVRNNKNISKTTTRIDSSHCIDVNSKVATAIFELVLNDAILIKKMGKKEQGKILQKLTGYKYSTFVKNFSFLSTPIGKEFTREAEEFLNPLLEQVE